MPEVKRKMTITLPEEDVESFLKVMEEIRFAKESREGFEQIQEGKFISLEDYEKKEEGKTS